MPRRSSLARNRHCVSRRRLNYEPLEDRRLLTSTRLDDPQAPVGDVLSYEVSADEQFAVYLADQDTNSITEVYSVEFATGTVRKLNAPLVRYGRVFDFEISADSQHIVYRATQNISNVQEIYSVSIRGGDATKLNPNFSVGQNVAAPNQVSEVYDISPDSSTVVYLAFQDAAFELFSVPIEGGTATKLNGPLVERGGVMQPPNGRSRVFQIDNNSSNVVYLANQEAIDVYELYSVPLRGGTVTKISNGNVTRPGFDLEDAFQITPDGSRVVYLSRDAVFDIYSVPILGGEIEKLNESVAAGFGVQPDFQISPDGSRVIFRFDALLNDIQEIFSSPVEGGGATKLNPALADGGDVVKGFAISPDGSRVVYRADQDTDEVFELYSVPLAGGDAMKLNGPLVDEGDVSFPTIPFVFTRETRTFGISPDSSTVVYLADQDTDETHELYVVPIAGGDATKISDPLVVDGDVQNDFQITPDNSRVVYRADQDIDEASELYSVSLTGGGSTELTAAIDASGDVERGFQIVGGNRTIYLADQELDGVTELFHSNVIEGNSEKLSGELLPVGDIVTTAVVSPNEQFVVYIADHETDDVNELYSVKVDTGTVTKLNDPLAVDGRVRDFLISPDSSRVVYRATQDSASSQELFTVPITGGGSTKLNGPLDENAFVMNYQITPDSSRALFVAGDFFAEEELFSVPIEGGSLSTVNDPLVERGGVSQFAVTSDSTRVVYVADQDELALFELYTAPITGGGSTKLNDPLIERGRVDDFEISPDDNHIVYSAQQDGSIFELFHSPITGGGSTKINGTDEGNRPSSFEITPDSSRVVYRAATGSSFRAELFTAPIGGGEVMKLAPEELKDGVIGFELTPDGSTAVYQHSDQLGRGLYAVPISGGDPRRLNDIGDERRVNEFHISPDGSQIVYTEEDADRINELYSVPIEGGDVVQLNRPVGDEGGKVRGRVEVSPDSRLVVFTQENQNNSRHEVHTVPIGGGCPTQLFDTAAGIARFLTVVHVSADSERIFHLTDQPLGASRALHLTMHQDVENLHVTSLEPTSSGFTLEFSREFSPEVLNLFSAQNGGFGAADLMVEGAATGPVVGSFVLDESATRATFIKSGGPLVPDTYTVTLRSRPDGFTAPNGVLLDGDCDATNGGDFVESFSIVEANAEPVVVSLPDFVRGPGQDVNLPADDGAGIPLTVSDATEVRNATVEIRYDPALLNITGATVGASMPSESSVSLDTATAGVAIVNFTSPVELPAGEAILVELEASIPREEASSTYGRQQILELTEVALSDVDTNPVASTADAALHLATFFADVSGNGRVNAADATQVARIAALLDEGSPGLPLTDPAILGDVSGNGRLNAADASLVAAFAALLEVPEIPPIPSGVSVSGLTLEEIEGQQRDNARPVQRRPLAVPALNTPSHTPVEPVSIEEGRLWERWDDETQLSLMLETALEELFEALVDG